MNQLWFRYKYLNDLKNKQMHLTIREGRRDKFHPKGYKIKEVVLARCFDIPGIDEFRTHIIITELVFRKIRDLQDNDLIGAPKDSLTKETARKALESIYNRKFLDDDVITLVKFAHL